MNTQAIRLPVNLINAAKTSARANMRTVPAQIAYWSKIGKAAIDNPDLPISFIQACFEGLEETKNGDITPFNFGK